MPIFFLKYTLVYIDTYMKTTRLNLSRVGFSISFAQFFRCRWNFVTIFKIPHKCKIFQDGGNGWKSMDNNRHAKIAISWTPDGKRKRRCPKETWRRTIERERQDLWFQWQTDATRVAKKRHNWRGLVKGPILLKERCVQIYM